MSDDDFTKKIAQQLQEAVDSPQAKAQREMAGSPLVQQMRAWADSPQAKALREIADSPVVQRMRAWADSPQAKALSEMANSPLGQRMSASWEARVPEAWRGFENSPEIQRLIKQFSDYQIAARVFVLPGLDTVQRIAMETSRVVEPYRAVAMATIGRGVWHGR